MQTYFSSFLELARIELGYTLTGSKQPKPAAKIAALAIKLEASASAIAAQKIEKPKKREVVKEYSVADCNGYFREHSKFPIGADNETCRKALFQICFKEGSKTEEEKMRLRYAKVLLKYGVDENSFN